MGKSIWGIFRNVMRLQLVTFACTCGKVHLLSPDKEDIICDKLIIIVTKLCNYRSTESICVSLEAISGWLGPNLCPQWSTPRKWPIRTSQSFAFNSGTKCSITPLSTVWRSITLNDGNGKDLWNESGNRLPQVSSPMKVIFFFKDVSCEMRLSSVIFELAKLLPASTKVGKLPVEMKARVS